MKIVIPASKRPLLVTLIQRIDTKYADCNVSFLVQKSSRTLKLVSGQTPFFAECSFVLDERSTSLKDLKFSVDGSFIKQLTHYFQGGQDFEFDLNRQASGVMHIEVLDSSSLNKDEFCNAALRRCQCVDAMPAHLNYVTDNKHRPTTTTSKATLERILYEAEGNLPFEYLELNKDKQHIRIQRNGEVADKALPRDLKLPVSLVLTPSTTEQMKELCQITSCNEIDIAQQGEAVTFKTNECTLTCSLAGVEEFYNKKPELSRTLMYIALNLFDFKIELDHCVKKYSRIKKARQAFLYLGESKAAVAVLIEPYCFVHLIHVFKVGHFGQFAGDSLFSFSPHDLDDIKIKDSFEARKMRLDIIETASGKLKLGVVYSLADKLPNDTISIEKDTDNLGKVLEMIKKLEEKQDDSNSSHPLEQQGNLFPFSDYPDEYEVTVHQSLIDSL